MLVAVSAGIARPVFWAPFLQQRPTHKRKGGQVRFSNDQTLQLEKKFNVQKYMSPPERKRLAKSLQLTERQVAPITGTISIIIIIISSNRLSLLYPYVTSLFVNGVHTYMYISLTAVWTSTGLPG